jgi:hypothetical protein
MLLFCFICDFPLGTFVLPCPVLDLRGIVLSFPLLLLQLFSHDILFLWESKRSQPFFFPSRGLFAEDKVL